MRLTIKPPPKGTLKLGDLLMLRLFKKWSLFQGKHCYICLIRVILLFYDWMDGFLKIYNPQKAHTLLSRACLFLPIKCVSTCNRKYCGTMIEKCFYVSFLVYLCFKKITLVNIWRWKHKLCFQDMFFPPHNYVMGKHYGYPSKWNPQGHKVRY